MSNGDLESNTRSKGRRAVYRRHMASSKSSGMCSLLVSVSGDRTPRSLFRSGCMIPLCPCSTATCSCRAVCRWDEWWMHLILVLCWSGWLSAPAPSAGRAGSKLGDFTSVQMGKDCNDFGVLPDPTSQSVSRSVALSPTERAGGCEISWIVTTGATGW